MTRLFIHGIGVCALGEDAPFAAPLGEMAEIPIKDYAPASARRRYGRAAKLMIVAASRALADAGIADPSEVAVVAGTALGELRASLEIICQIRETRGGQVSPALVPNSVHNAPAGHLTIAQKNHSPSVTVSEGWLSGEAAIGAAADVLESSGCKKALVVVGDEVDATWGAKLADAGAKELAEALEAESFQEGAVAFVVGSERGEKPLGAIEADVMRARDIPAAARALVARVRGENGGAPEVFLRVGASGSALREAVEGTVAGLGVGTSQVSALLELARIARDPAVTHALVLGAEVDELGWIHFSRSYGRCEVPS